ncbi:MAG: chitobiase/beta-hexosaminidase C-terminal domain-containing protein [Anaerolineae bacterium]
MIVVEAAGNGSENLDDPFYLTAKPGHTPFTAVNDSGAIIVGSANSAWTTYPRTRAATSTYGSTVDLNGWSMHLIAPGYGDYYNNDGASLSYTLFGGTSGASPMITAAAAIVQANTIAKNGSPASPTSVKQMLQDNSTPQESVNGENIGPMPDLRQAINAIWNLPNPAAPIITPASGAYNMPMQVTIDYGDASQNSSNTHLRYTLDGSEPTIDSFIFVPEFGDALYLNYGVTVRACAFSSNAAAGRFLASDAAAAIYTSTTPKAATPQISPTGGSFGQGTQITISTSTPGATIKYRTDGRAPYFFYPGTSYSGPITLAPGTYTIAARAYKDGYYKSDAAYSGEISITPITLPAPTIYPNSGDYAGEVTVYLGSTVLGAEIRYTTDGSTPTEASPLYVQPIPLTSSATVKARVYLAGYTPSNVVSAAFTITAQAADPIFTPASGSAGSNSLQVTLTTSTPGATIRYTTNGTDPTTYSTAYTSPINLGIGQHTLKARAFLDGAAPSSIVTASYTMYDPSANIATPTINPPNGNFNGPITVTLATDTENVDMILYTLVGTDPQSSSTVQVCSGPFQLTGDATYFIRVRAYKSGVGNNNMGAATLVVVKPTQGPVADPIISPPGGQYTNTVSVQVQAPDFSSPFNIRRLYVRRTGLTRQQISARPETVPAAATSLASLRRKR